MSRKEIKLYFVGVFLCCVTQAWTQELLQFHFQQYPLSKILDRIEQQSSYRFFYNIKEVNDQQLVSLTANKESIYSVLHKLRQLKGIRFKMNQNQIVLSNDIEIQAQLTKDTYRLIGNVLDNNGSPLVGANIRIKGKYQGTQSNFNGYFALHVPCANPQIEISYLGFRSQSLLIHQSEYRNIRLHPNAATLQNVILVGSRSIGRSNTQSNVPVDVIDIEKINKNTGYTSLSAALNILAPSFLSQPQTVSDGTDHTDPASLRGLGPDQVLVLINGKRRHTSALLNVNGTIGTGSVGTDLNALPMNSIEKIEVLRDGASAQYGSDAIAGVINVILKKQKDYPFQLGIHTGGNYSKNSNHLSGGVDGEQILLHAGVNLPIGNTGGFFNLYSEFVLRQPAWRNGSYTGNIFRTYHGAERVFALQGGNVAQMRLEDYRIGALELPYLNDDLKQQLQGLQLDKEQDQALFRSLLNGDADTKELKIRGLSRDDFRFQVGPSQLKESKSMFHLGIPVYNNTEFYAFGGFSFRQGEASGFYRRPAQEDGRANTSLHPNGFLPKIKSAIYDQALTLGLQSDWNKWEIDFSNTFGKNVFDMHVVQSTNATLRDQSPRNFEAGGFRFAQNTTNLDLHKYFEILDRKFNFALGTEFKHESYRIVAGEEASYTTYDIHGNAVDKNTQSEDLVRHNFFGTPLIGGAQMYKGFDPDQCIHKTRYNISVYADVEMALNKKWHIGLASRFEHYSDFGSTFNYKIASRYHLSKPLSIRAALSTGFRAPSLHQQYFRRTSTIFIENKAFEAAIFPNHSMEAAMLKIPKLQEELSQNISAGFTFNRKTISFTLDAYHIQIQDRIVLSGSFGHGNNPDLAQVFEREGATSARFLVNAIDTKSFGIELVASHQWQFNSHWVCSNHFSATISDTKVTKVHYPEVIQLSDQKNSFFDAQEEAFITLAQPKTKWHLAHLFQYKALNFQIRNTYFGSVTDPDALVGISRLDSATIPKDAIYTGKVLTDFSIGWAFNRGFSLQMGVNNMLDVYPSTNRAESTAGNQFVYSRRTSQFGYGGRYIFGKILFHL
ncbi:MAG: TonB-dependent receptor [Flavobacteriaceae bacterium]|nr:TonB-dependent receptor [Flavobacteriaceae bacterium]